MLLKPSLRFLCLVLGAQLLVGGAAEMAIRKAPLIQNTWTYINNNPTDFSDWTFSHENGPEKSDNYVRDDEDYEWGDTEERCSRYESLYGYRHENPDPGVVTYLHYVSFSRYVPWGGGVDGTNDYFFCLGISNQELDEYLAYLWRFGYDIERDATEGGVRRVTLRNPNAPSYLPETLRCDLYLPSEDLIIIDTLATEQAYAEAEKALPAQAEDEIGKPVAIAGDATLTLDSFRALHRFAVTNNDQPIDPRAPITLLADSTQFPIFTRTLTSGQVVSVIKSDTDTEFNERFILLSLTLDYAGGSLSTDDLDFMLESDGTVISPVAVATGLTREGSLFVLDTARSKPLTGKQPFYLAFPVDDLIYRKPLRLHVSLAADRLPLWERPSIGFILTK